MFSFIKKILIAGLIVWVPLVATYLVIKFLIELFDSVLVLLPKQYHPEVLLGIEIPGLGLMLSVVILFITGLLFANFFGNQLIRFGEAVLNKIPLVRTIYHGSKQIVQAVVGNSDKSFEKVFLLEYPRRGLWTIAFQTSSNRGEPHDLIYRLTSEYDLVNVYVPTTPNPTSGFFLMVPKSDLTELAMPVDDALKMVISIGVVMPTNVADKLARQHTATISVK